jgi:hypothetical protein
MLSAKFRSELDERGVIVEDKALSTRHVHAKFYDLILKGTQDERKGLIDTHIDRYIEQLTAEVKDNVRTFGLAIVNADGNDGNPKGSFINHYGIDLGTADNDAKATDHYNSYISSKKVNGWHLTSGHVLAVGDERWICLSPACDMYPGQRIVGISPGKTGSIRPFVAAQLHKRKKPIREADQIQSNNFLFLQENNGIVAYCINGGGDTDGDRTRLPNWKMFLALNDGKLIESGVGKTIKLISLESEAGAIKSTETDVEVIAQLRYEYALNLIHKLGASMTRVGLDFASPSSPIIVQDEKKAAAASAKNPGTTKK